MAQDIEENIGKILKTQNCKKNIENKLSNKKLKAGKQTINSDRMELNCMLFQVAKQGFLTDHVYFFPCIFELDNNNKITKENRLSTDPPKSGSFIRTIKMDFDIKEFHLVIYDYQYLGGEGSIAPSNAAKVNWNSETISQVIRKNSTVKGGQIILDSYVNESGPKQTFEYPAVKFLTVRGIQKFLSESQRQSIDVTFEKIKIPKDEENQSKSSGLQDPKMRLEEEF